MNAGPGWDDTVLPGFDQPDEPVQRVQSAKDRDDALNRIVWTRYKVPNIQCVDCVIEFPQGKRTGIGAASWLRVKGEDKRALCWMHKSEYMVRDQRNGQ